MTAVIGRILLALDAAADARTAIDVAVRLAARAGVALHAVFVEDEELLNLASLPIAREVVAGTRGGGLKSGDVELYLRAAASRAQQDVVGAARLHDLEFSFQIVRGGAEAAFSIASESDLVVAAALARPVAGYFRVASCWHQALECVPGAILLARESGTNSAGVVVLLHERGTGSARMLHAAARIAELGGGSLTVLCPDALATAPDTTEWIDQQAVPVGLKPRIETAPDGLAALQARIGELGCGLLAIDRAAPECHQLTAIAGRLNCNILIVN
jgi:hypothetical protein